MSFEEVMEAVGRWQVGTEALAALGALLTLEQSGESVPPEVAGALRAVVSASGLGDLSDLAPPQKAMVATLARLYNRHAAELLENPGREPGWTFTDPVILDGWGRASMSVPPVLAAATPDLGDVRSFLDVGTGVGLLAVAAAGVWPAATVVGLDTWEPSLARARDNVTQAGLDDRIELRNQDVVDIDDVDRFDLAWVPTFFLSEPALTKALPKVVESLRPGGAIVLGRLEPPGDPLAGALAALYRTRTGGFDLAEARALELLEEAGCTRVHAAPRTAPIPLELVVGTKP
jgi:SAM-dependent methyltransferase